MKLKVFALTIALMAGVFTASAQGSDVFVGIGGGVITNYSDHFNTPSFYGQIQVGKYITPIWGVRGVIGGPFQKLEKESLAVGWADAGLATKQTFGELNIDGMVNLSQLFSEASLPKVDFYLFMGPTMDFSSAFSKHNGDVAYNGVGTTVAPMVVEDSSFKVRVGATVGLGLAYNFTNKLALGLEGRFAATPSVFGPASVNSFAQGNLRGTLNLVYTIGGKSGKDGYAKKIAEAAGYVSAATAAAMVADALEKNPKIVEKPVEKIVEKVVEKQVNVGMATPTAIFFEINKSNIVNKDKARIQLLAEAIKAGAKDAKYEVAGYADKATGSAATNQKLSEKRAQTVYDALVAEGVPASQLEKAAYGGVNPLFFNSDALSRAVIVRQK